MKKEMSPKKILVAGILTPIIAFILAFFVLCISTMCKYSPTYLARVITHWDSDVSDYKIFPVRVVKKSENPYTYEKNIDNSLNNININYKNKQNTLNEFVKDTNTTSFIIVKSDKIIYEQYENGYDENSINTSFSMAKSVVSMLIGKAIENGSIKSIKEPISNYLTEFKNTEIGEISIESLLLMRSNIEYEENKSLWFGDDSLTYWYDDLRKLALNNITLTDRYNGKFHYNNYNPLLLGMILERSTKVSVSEYFEKEIWQKIGAKNNATWSLDSEKTKFEKMESGINFKAIDFVKIGSLILHNGFWNGEQIINADWLTTSTLCDFPLNADEYKDTFLEGKNIGYKYMWYSTPSTNSYYDIIAWGKSDQILYISPANDIVILRTGKTDGKVSNWVDIIKQIINAINY